MEYLYFSNMTGHRNDLQLCFETFDILANLPPITSETKRDYK